MYYCIIIFFQTLQQMSIIHIIQIRIIGFITFLEEDIGSLQRFIKTFQVSIIIHCQTIERSMTGILLQSHISYFE